MKCSPPEMARCLIKGLQVGTLQVLTWRPSMHLQGPRSILTNLQATQWQHSAEGACMAQPSNPTAQRASGAPQVTEATLLWALVPSPTPCLCVNCLFPLLQRFALLFSRGQSHLSSTVPPHPSLLRSAHPPHPSALLPGTCSAPLGPHRSRDVSHACTHAHWSVAPLPAGQRALSAQGLGPPSTLSLAHRRCLRFLQ